MHEPPAAVKSALYKLNIGLDSVPLRFVRVPSARRYILRLTPEREVRVTIPRGGSLDQAYAFARKHSGWITSQLCRTSSEWKHGSLIYFRGEQFELRIENGVARLGSLEIPLHAAASIRQQIEVFLGQLAVAELPPRLREFAAAHGLRVRCIRIGNQRTRWGSCSSSGTVSLNWRLIQTPDFVRDYIIIHELMHFHEMNHSDRFWARVAKAFPAYEDAERWLRKNGRQLR